MIDRNLPYRFLRGQPLKWLLLPMFAGPDLEVDFDLTCLVILDLEGSYPNLKASYLKSNY